MIYVHIVLVAGSSKSVKFRATQENVFFSRARTTRAYTRKNTDTYKIACYAATCCEVYAHQQDNVAIRKINE